ncbi:MAG: hypothetical protein KJZ83_00090 [Burkholderiaceae bacterium]|nr:hypothetical protein [Burkholderiaceae bacterium]
MKDAFREKALLLFKSHAAELTSMTEAVSTGTAYRGSLVKDILKEMDETTHACVSTFAHYDGEPMPDDIRGQMADTLRQMSELLCELRILAAKPKQD